MVAGFHGAHHGADLFNDPGALMAEDDRQFRREGAVPEVHIRMADTDRFSRTSTSRGPGLSMVTSSMDSGLFGSRITAAFMGFLRSYLFSPELPGKPDLTSAAAT